MSTAADAHNQEKTISVQKVVLRGLGVGLHCAVSACATLVNGTTREIPVIADSAGTRVLVDGAFVGASPLRVPVARTTSHTVRLASDSQVVNIGRSVSPWVFGNLLLYAIPAVVDFSGGGAFNLKPDSIDTRRMPRPGGEWQLARGQMVRVDSGRWVTVDSEAAGSVFTRSGTFADGKLDVIRLTSRYDNALGAAGKAMRVTAPIILLPYLGGIVWVGAGVGGAIYGAGRPIERFAPIVAYREGTGLMLDDDVRMLTTRGEIRGTLASFTRTDLHVWRNGEKVRVLRSDVGAMERSSGRNFGRAAQIGASVGAMIGGITLAAMPPNMRDEFGGMWFVAGEAGLGAVISIPFARKRWIPVKLNP